MPMNNHEPENSLEQLMHRHFQALPGFSAPVELIPNVLQTIAAQKAKVWWKCSWTEWPREMQILSAVLLTGLLAVLCFFSGGISTAAGTLADRAADALQFLRPLWTVVEALFVTLQVLTGSIKAQFLIIGMTILALFYFCAIALGTMFYRVAAQQNHPSP